LADTLSCIIALIGFIAVLKVSEKKGKRIESLATFLIGIALALVGFYFAYNGLERLMYPIAVAYSKKYALLVTITVFVKIFMGIVYVLINRKQSSSVFKTLILDSFLDCAITITALMGFSLTTKLNYAVDGVFAVIIGLCVAISAIKTVVEQAKFLVND
jgi:divalent metal cation (Fe/Co/Zn/Cd) transporter